MREESVKIGIMGGTFDPVHYGHLIVAESVREEFGLDKVMFIPSGHPPHKANVRVEAPEHRFNMIQGAISSNPFFEASRIEIDRVGYTYTVDTLSQLRVLYGDAARFFFIVGADVVPELETWKDFKKVFALCEFIAVFRPGFDKDHFVKEIESLKINYMAKIHIVNAPLVQISSTDIRRRIAAGKSVRYMVPESVEAYIRNEGIYSTSDLR